MKTIASLALVAALFIAGCASLQTNAGKILTSTALTVDAGMKGFASWKVNEGVTPQQEAIVKNLYSKYQMAMTSAQAAYVALSAGNSALWNTASTNLAVTSGNVMSAISSFTSTNAIPVH